MFSSRKSSAPKSGASPATLSKSLRLRSSASAYLNRTPSSSTNRQIWTWSGWVKRGSIGGSQVLFGAGPDGSNYTIFYFSGVVAENLEIYNYTGGANVGYVYTTSVFRDPSAWYHIVLAIDTTQSVSANRTKIYVNNVLQPITINTTFASSVNTWVNTNNSHRLGCTATTSAFYDGYMTDVYLIDGQALTPSSFGTTNATTGQWSPGIYSGSYGTNGFHLTFANTTSTTTLGYDTSGNSNNWTTNNISLTAGSTYDSMNDVPVASSATAANYAVLNPLAVVTSNNVLSNGNLTVAQTGSTTTDYMTSCGFGMTSNAKWYFEVTFVTGGSGCGIGITSNPSSTFNFYPGFDTSSYLYISDGSKAIAGTYTSYGSSYGAGAVIGVAYDGTSGTLTFYKNNTSQGSAVTSLTGTFFALVANLSGSGTNTLSFNFGQQPFTYTPPSGYVALNTYNLPTPTIAQGNKYFDISLWTGNGSSQTITNSGVFQPDFVWAKGRSDAYSNILVNAVTGANQFLLTDSTQAEATSSALVSAFTSSGFSIGSSTSINNSSSTYVGWQWKANGSGSSNTNGSITSTVSASTTAGFSIVTYTGTGTAGTIGHGLGVAPSMIIVKSRSAVGDWPVYHSSVGNGSYTLLDTNAASAASSTIWNATSPTSSVFSVGINTVSNTVSVTYVAYCFAPIAGFSAFGSYTGNNSTDGPFVYCGFRPAYIMVKRSSSAGNNWQVLDTKRSTYNVMADYLYASSSAKENYDTAVGIDSLSNGFKIRGTDGNTNSSGATYIYMAFAENPFQYANAR